MANNIDSLTLKELYLSHAASADEVKEWLNALILTVEENAEAFEQHHVSARIYGTAHHHVSFTLIITMPPRNSPLERLKCKLHKTLPKQHALAQTNYRAFETAPSFILVVSDDRFKLGHLPRTKEVINTVKWCLAKTGWPMFNDVLEELDRLQPVENYYYYDDGDFSPSLCGMYPRNGASLDNCLRNLDYAGERVDASKLYSYTARELNRIKGREYTALPPRVIDMIPREIYLRETPHLAAKGSNVGKVAYTENHKKGINDIQSVMKPGKYLRRVLKNQIRDDQHLKELVAEMVGSVNPEFKTTRFPAEAAQVYMNGPSSCMSYDEDRFHETYDLDDEWRHPIEALFFDDGSGSIELHYMVLGGRIAARALVNTNTDEYPSFYVADWAGDNGRDLFTDHLSQFEHDDNALAECVIPRIELRNGAYLCPYIDHKNMGVREFNYDRLIIGGPYQAPYEKGYVHLEEMRTCDDCEETVPEDETTYIESNELHVCEYCLDDYPYALDDNGDHERMPDCDVEPLGFDHRHATYGFYFDRVVSDIDQSALNDAGLCRTIDGEIHRTSECTLAEDDEWVPDDEIEGDAATPDSLHSSAYINTDSGVEHINNCVWLDDEEKWVSGNDVDYDMYLIRFTNWYYIAEPIQEEQDDEAA